MSYNIYIYINNIEIIRKIIEVSICSNLDFNTNVIFWYEYFPNCNKKHV